MRTNLLVNLKKKKHDHSMECSEIPLITDTSYRTTSVGLAHGLNIMC